jgi:hypothetical protein
MKPPYPKELDDALESISQGKVRAQEYAQILDDPELTADFVRQRLESKRKWYEDCQEDFKLGEEESWQDMVLRVVYKGNLGIEVPRDGKVVYSEGNLLIIDWQSWCPVLMYCAHTGQATVQVCSLLYHMQFQYLLSLVLPGALFTRDYSRIRPGSYCCREIIFYDQEKGKEQFSDPEPTKGPAEVGDKTNN